MIKKFDGLKLHFIKPVWKAGTQQIEKEGTVVFRFGKLQKAPDGTDKLMFPKSANICLKINEAAALLTARPVANIYHDPDKGTPAEGTRTKSFFVDSDGTNVSMALSLGGSSTDKASYKFKLLPQEWEAIKIVMQFGFPRLVGFDKVF